MKKFINHYNLLFYLPLGILMIASFFCMVQAKYVKEIYNYHLLKQILWFSIGFVIILIFKKIKLPFFFRYSVYFYWTGIFLLGLVLIFGKEINGARAWFDLKFFHFQPSEFMKIPLLLYLASITRKFNYRDKKYEFTYLSKCLLIVLIPSILVFLEPDTGAIIFYLLILIAVFLFSGIHKRWFIIGFLTISIIVGSFIYLYCYQQEILINLIGTSFFYRVDRIIHFYNQEGMQIGNALITIGNAGFLGKGIQNSILYVPEFPTDFAFSLFLSIFGFIGGIIILFCYFLLTIFFIQPLKKIKKVEYSIFIHGFLFIFLFQLLYNIFMNLGLLPIMGIPLPFLSYGGSNLIIFFIFLGIVLNITKKART